MSTAMNPIKWLISSPHRVDDATLATTGPHPINRKLVRHVLPRALCWGALFSLVAVLKSINDPLSVKLLGMGVFFVAGFVIAQSWLLAFYALRTQVRFKKLRPLAKRVQVGHPDNPHPVYLDVPKGHRVVFTYESDGSRRAKVVAKKQVSDP